VEVGIDLVLQKQEMLAFILFPVEMIANHKIDASLLPVRDHHVDLVAFVDGHF
jgi:hypothetical protein